MSANIIDIQSRRRVTGADTIVSATASATIGGIVVLTQGCRDAVEFWFSPSEARTLARDLLQSADTAERLERDEEGVCR